jgi:hypothetical protein
MYDLSKARSELKKTIEREVEVSGEHVA